LKIQRGWNPRIALVRLPPIRRPILLSWSCSVLRSDGRPFHGSPRSSFTRRRTAHTAAHDLWAHPAGSVAMRALLTTLPCHLASGRGQPWRMIYPRMGVVAETPCSRILAIGIASALSGSASAARQESAMNADSSGDHAGPRAISGCAVARRSKSI
jgi:hypothetical protein